MDGNTFEISPRQSTIVRAVGSLESCSVLDTVEIRVVPLFTVPYFFSPNGDGEDDQWLIDGLDMYPNYKLYVYNRWGNKVRSYHRDFKPWDGKNEQGIEVSEGTYFYVIETLVGKRESSISGHVTIIR